MYTNKNGWWHRRDTPLYLRAWKCSQFFAVKLTKAGVIIEHVPKKISSTCLLFISSGGVISCEVTNPNRRTQGICHKVALKYPVYLSFKAINN